MNDIIAGQAAVVIRTDDAQLARGLGIATGRLRQFARTLRGILRQAGIWGGAGLLGAGILGRGEEGGAGIQQLSRSFDRINQTVVRVVDVIASSLSPAFRVIERVLSGINAQIEGVLRGSYTILHVAVLWWAAFRGIKMAGEGVRKLMEWGKGPWEGLKYIVKSTPILFKAISQIVEGRRVFGIKGLSRADARFLVAFRKYLYSTVVPWVSDPAWGRLMKAMNLRRQLVMSSVWGWWNRDLWINAMRSYFATVFAQPSPMLYLLADAFKLLKTVVSKLILAFLTLISTTWRLIIAKSSELWTFIRSGGLKKGAIFVGGLLAGASLYALRALVGLVAALVGVVSTLGAGLTALIVIGIALIGIILYLTGVLDFLWKILKGIGQFLWGFVQAIIDFVRGFLEMAGIIEPKTTRGEAFVGFWGGDLPNLVVGSPAERIEKQLGGIAAGIERSNTLLANIQRSVEVRFA